MSTTAAETANRKMERCDIAILEALAAAPDQTMRWEDRIENRRLPALAGAPAGAPPRLEPHLVQGLESSVNAWCDAHPHLVVHQLKEVEVTFKNAPTQRYTPEPRSERCTISRLEALVGGGLVEHVGGPDEDSAKKPTRELKLSKAGAQVLDHWKKGRVQGLAYPDPKAPKAKAEEPKLDQKDEKKLEAAKA